MMLAERTTRQPTALSGRRGRGGTIGNEARPRNGKRIVEQVVYRNSKLAFVVFCGQSPARSFAGPNRASYSVESGSVMRSWIG
jgi:hypothetical protein